MMRVFSTALASAYTIAIVVFAPASLRASPELDAAIALVEQKQFASARAALEKIVAVESQNAVAYHYLGRAFNAGADKVSTEQAVKWLGRAAELEPQNATYLAAHGRALLQLAGQSKSLSAATTGRDVLEKAVALNPGQLDAREALFRFYQLAPWPLGSRAKADAHLAEICQRDRIRGSALLVQRAELAVQRGSRDARELLGDRAVAAAPTPEAQRKLRALRSAMKPVSPPIDLAEVTGNRVYLSDLAWVEARVGWGQPARNHAWFDEKIQDGVLLTLRGEFFEKGLYAHASSCYIYALDGKWRTFTAVIGLRDGAHPMGSAVFVVRGDGRELYRSPLLRVSSPSESVRVNIAGVKQLELHADGAEGHNHFSWAIWANPEVQR
jgi:tetratricopeptide (TPR) repeat protein